MRRKREGKKEHNGESESIIERANGTKDERTKETKVESRVRGRIDKKKTGLTDCAQTEEHEDSQGTGELRNHIERNKQASNDGKGVKEAKNNRQTVKKK